MNTCLKTKDCCWYEEQTIPYALWFWYCCPLIQIETLCSRSFYTIVFLLEKHGSCRTFIQWIGQNIPGSELCLGYNTHNTNIGVTRVPWYDDENETVSPYYDTCHMLVFLQDGLLPNTSPTVFSNEYARSDFCIDRFMNTYGFDSIHTDAYFLLGRKEYVKPEPEELRWTYLLTRSNYTKIV